MSTLYLDRKELELRHEGEHVCLYEDGSRRTTVPVRLIERVVILGRATLSTGVLGLLAEHDVGLMVLSGRNHRFLASITGKPGADVFRRVGQFRHYCDDDFRVKASRSLMLMKLRGQARMLREAADLRPDLRKPLRDGLETVEGCISRLRGQAVLSLESLRGLEGAAAAAYFAAFTRLLPPSLGFEGRNRRPPRDPVNACLSLAYTLLHFEASTACSAAGLDPYLGFYHEPAHGRESLASDLIEPLRSRVDRCVWELFRSRVLRGENFSSDKGKCLLNKNGRKIFYLEYERFVPSLRRLLRRSAALLARRLSVAP